MQSTRIINSTPEADVLAVALELSGASWKIGFHDGKRDKPAIQTVSDVDAKHRIEHVIEEIEKTKAKWQLPAETRSVVLYEAGQDAFWIERTLTRRGYECVVCDPASIPVERHARRAKTDRLDVIRLVTSLRGWLRGEQDRMRVVHVPDADAEARRHLVRDRGELQKEIMQHTDRIRKLLRTVGCWRAVGAEPAADLARGEFRCHDGTPLPPELQARLEREGARLALAQQQLGALEKNLIEQLPEPVRQRIATLQRLRAVGPVGATRLVLELFWRRFDTRRQVGSCLGLTPQPYDSGTSRVDQGISKQGNRRVRSLLIEMAWFWLRYQPDSALARWFAQRTSNIATNKRGKRIAIVAVARRLAIALWRYLEHGIVPDGAQLKPQV